MRARACSVCVARRGRLPRGRARGRAKKYSEISRQKVAPAASSAILRLDKISARGRFARFENERGAFMNHFVCASADPPRKKLQEEGTTRLLRTGKRRGRRRGGAHAIAFAAHARDGVLSRRCTVRKRGRQTSPTAGVRGVYRLAGGCRTLATRLPSLSTPREEKRTTRSRESRFRACRSVSAV